MAQLIVAPGEGQVNAGPLVWLRLTKVSGELEGTLFGRVSVQETLVASAGPKFVKVIVYVTSVSAAAALGPLLLITRSAVSGGVDEPAMELLFSSLPSNVSLVIVAWLMYVVPFGASLGT
jgi:hypothetical protein